MRVRYNLGRSIARRFLITLFDDLVRCGLKASICDLQVVVRLSVLPGSGPHSDITYQSSIHLPCQYVVKPVLDLSSVRALKRVRYTTSRCSIVRVGEGEFVISCVSQ